ncbi:MAG: OmpA family protein [Nitrospirae bacterium YQR-1]
MSYKKLIANSKSSGDENLWLITMTDLMSLLLVCFVMFFIITRNKEKALERAANQGTLKKVQNGETVKDSSSEAAQSLNSAIKELNLQNDVTVASKNNEVVITMRERVTFEPANAEILQDSAGVLDSVAEIIKKYPSFIIEIDGHTDNVPIKNRQYPSNWELSTARATSVLKYFTNMHSIEASRFYVKGNAEERPVAPNDTPEHRALNRRVEIRLRDAGIQETEKN